jgi:hypothetical protein
MVEYLSEFIVKHQSARGQFGVLVTVLGADAFCVQNKSRFATIFVLERICVSYLCVSLCIQMLCM